MEFSEWLREEMQKQGLGVRELARMANVSPAGISKVLNQYRGAGPELCQGLARALKLPQEEVLQRAGILTRPSTSLKLFGQLTTAQRAVILDQMRDMVAKNEYQRRTVPCNELGSALTT